MGLMDRKHCPCCGKPIIVGQEICLNCHAYLWEVADGMDDQEQTQR